MCRPRAEAARATCRQVTIRGPRDMPRSGASDSDARVRGPLAGRRWATRRAATRSFHAFIDTSGMPEPSRLDELVKILH
jgi:hypothetical protein